MDDTSKQIAYLATALKAPRIRDAAARLAVQAREAGWNARPAPPDQRLRRAPTYPQ